LGGFAIAPHAEGHLRVLKQVMPMADFAIAFDLMGE
jgi:predicted metalloendopeptidase